MKLDELLINHRKISASLLHYEPLKFFSEYLQQCAFPYFVEGDYYNRVLNTLDKVIYDDIMGVSGIKPDGAATIKKLIAFLATSTIPKISAAKLCSTLDITKPTLYNYLDLMERVRLITRVPPEKIGRKFLFSSYSITVPDVGDFSIRFNGKRIVFEIGGPGKAIRQIKNEENAFVLKDGTETGHAQIIPLYLIGMMY